MPYYDFDPSLDFDAQEQQMLQAAARIKALRGMKLDTTIDQPEGFRSAVTGASFLAPTVKKPLLSSLTPLVQDTVAGVQEKQLDQQRSALSRQEQQAMQDWIRQTPQSTQEQQLEVGAVGPELETVTKPPTREALLSHAMAGAANPAARPLSQAMLQDIMVHGPTREQQTKIELMKERNAALQKSLDRQTQIQAAEIKAKGGGNFKESGLLDKGAKIYSTPDGRWFSARNPLGAPGTNAIPADATRDPNFTGDTSRPLPEDAAPAPITPNQSAQDAVTAGAKHVSVMQNFKERYNIEKPVGGAARVSQLPLVNEAAKTGIGDTMFPGVSGHAAYWSDFQAEVNDQLKALSGMNVTAQEMQRQKVTMPTATTDPKLVNEWFDRQIKLTNAAVARTQAVSTNRFARYDPKLNAFVDTSKRGNPVIEGTESPFSAAELKAPTPAATDERKVLPAEQAGRDVDARKIKQQELEQKQELLVVETDPGKKARIQGDIDALEKELGVKPTAKPPVPKVGEVRKGYRYKGGPPNSQGSWEKV